MKALRIALVLMFVLVLGACGGGDAATTEGDMAATGREESAGPTAEEQSLALGDEDAPEAAPEPAQRGVAAGVGSGGGAAAGGGADTGAPVEGPELEPLPDPALSGQRIIKEGTISIEVPEAKFDAAFQQVVAAARALGGDVIGSTTRTADDGGTFGSVTVRVPVEDFEDLLVDMRGVGKVRNQDIKSQDVSAEFTDLESRLRHLEALERFYLGLFDKADDVQDAIAVQQKLQAVQGQIEKAQGRLNMLDDRTSYSTLTIDISEPGVGAPFPEEIDPADGPTLGGYWDSARDAFINVVGAMLVVALFLLPLLLPLALLVVAGVAWQRSRRTPSPRIEPTDAEPERVSADA